MLSQTITHRLCVEESRLVEIEIKMFVPFKKNQLSKERK
jgi:hypothetical protein